MDLLRRLKDRTLVLKPNRIQETVPSNIHTLPNPQTPCVSEPITRCLDANHLPSFKQASPFWSQRAGPCFRPLPAIALESCRMPLRSRGIVSSLKTTITQARSRFQPVNQLRYNYFSRIALPIVASEGLLQANGRTASGQKKCLTEVRHKKLLVKFSFQRRKRRLPTFSSFPGN